MSVIDMELSENDKFGWLWSKP